MNLVMWWGSILIKKSIPPVIALVTAIFLHASTKSSRVAFQLLLEFIYLNLLANRAFDFHSCQAELTFLQDSSSDIPSCWLVVSSLFFSCANPILICSVLLCSLPASPNAASVVPHTASPQCSLQVQFYVKSKFWDKAFSCIDLVHILKIFLWNKSFLSAVLEKFHWRASFSYISNCR